MNSSMFAPTLDESVDGVPTSEGLIGCLLALLTHYARHPDLSAADHIARNLAVLARHPGVDAPLQAVCTRLFMDWLGPVDAQDLPAAEAWITVHDAPAWAQ